jgi:hypothetical protein
MKKHGFCHGCWELCDVWHCLCPCSGCNGEVYWSEWHNDPPCCQDPCDNHGQWIGPSNCGCGGYGNNGACGCEGGYSTGAYGYQGGYAANQSRPATTPSSPYAKHRPAYQPPIAASSQQQQSQQQMTQPQTRQMYAAQQQMNQQRQIQQQQQMRSASRPMPNRMPQQQSRGSNGTQQGKILW